MHAYSCTVNPRLLVNPSAIKQTLDARVTLPLPMVLLALGLR